MAKTENKHTIGMQELNVENAIQKSVEKVNEIVSRETEEAAERIKKTEEKVTDAEKRKPSATYLLKSFKENIKKLSFLDLVTKEEKETLETIVKNVIIKLVE